MAASGERGERVRYLSRQLPRRLSRQLPRRLPRRPRQAVAVLLLGLAAVLIAPAALAAVAADLPTPKGAEPPVLFDDDGNQPLFVLPAMTPGRTSTACLTVGYRNVAEATQVRLYVAGDGALARYLDVGVDIGDAGSSRDCSGFVPYGTVLAGRLDQVAAARPNWVTGLPVFIASPDSGSVGFRVRVSVVDSAAAQGLGATGSISWELRAGSGVTDIAVTKPPPPPAPPSPALRSASPTRSSATPPAALAPPGAPRSPGSAPATRAPEPVRSEPRPTSTPAAGVAPSPPVTTPGRPPGRVDASATDNPVVAAARAARDVAVAVSRRAAVPVLLLVLMGTFLLLQDFIDRRDPKLASAAAPADTELDFGPAPGAPRATS